MDSEMGFNQLEKLQIVLQKESWIPMANRKKLHIEIPHQKF